MDAYCVPVVLTFHASRFHVSRLNSPHALAQQPHVLPLHGPGQRTAGERRGEIRDTSDAGHEQGCGRIQDPYSVRCAAQVLGASLEELDACAATFLREAASVTDNPILFPETGEAISGGHFHGQPLALRLDALRLAAAEAASVAERRIDQLMNGNGGRLPRFLAAVPGLESGLMIAQYLAAALVSESKQAAFPASADSIPTSLGQEDHVSMGSVAALALEPTLARCEAVIALEMLTAARALQFIERRHFRRRHMMHVEETHDLQDGRKVSGTGLFDGVLHARILADCSGQMPACLFSGLSGGQSAESAEENRTLRPASMITAA